ncbi:hypothetical protein M3Y96_00332100 [Aphelenchoides besseyi]|nr:hypothetical protein M3Y96_00332100 [Aphelenchoides besseyi]
MLSCWIVRLCTLLLIDNFGSPLHGLQFRDRELGSSFRQFDMSDRSLVVPRFRQFRRPQRNPLRQLSHDLTFSSSKLTVLPLAQEENRETEEDEHCSLFPNRTIFEPHFYPCDSEEAPPVFVIHDVALTNETGDYVYPIDMTRTLRLFLDMTNFANRRFDNMRAEVSLYRRKTGGWLGCGWLRLPTFGLIDNFDVCENENNLSCPVSLGYLILRRQVFEVKLNPSLLFTGIVQMIHSDRVAYKLLVRLFNNRGSDQELACAAIQTRIQF